MWTFCLGACFSHLYVGAQQLRVTQVLWEFSVRHVVVVGEALCLGTKGRSIGGYEGNAEGMLSPCLGHNAQIHPRAPLGEKKNAIRKYQVMLCVSVARLSVGLLKTDGRTDQGWCGLPVHSQSPASSHPLNVIC